MIAAVKEKLHEYIDHADEKKLQAIYTLLKNGIEPERVYDEATLNSIRQTSKDYFAGTIKGYPMEESMERIRQQIGRK
jgi:hypothetical protein